MPATNRKNMSTDELLQLTMKSIQRVRKATRPTFSLLSVLGLVLLLAFSFACAPSSSEGNGKENQETSASGDLPELNEETIRDRIIGSRVRKIPEENGTGEPISWTFDESEAKEFTIVEKQIEGARATIVLDVKTSTAPNSRQPRQLAGQIRTEWNIEIGWMLRRWQIVNIENISMKYRNLPKVPEQNSNR